MRPPRSGRTNPNVYPQTQGLQTYPQITSTAQIQGSIFPNLLPSTTYHVIGQSYASGSWCTATDETFTTPARPAGTILATLPQTFNTAPPAITGNTWTYGSNCGTGGDTTGNVQNCFNAASPGDVIKFPPGTYNIGKIYMPVNPAAVIITCATGSPGTCTQSGSAPPNGTKIRFGYQILSGATIPTPIQPGVTYTVVGSSGLSFEVSYDGAAEKSPFFLLVTVRRPRFTIGSIRQLRQNGSRLQLQLRHPHSRLLVCAQDRHMHHSCQTSS